MSRKVGKRDSRYLAKLVTENRAPCAFCHREVDDEVTYGKLYAIGDIQCHYFCALLSCCLVQKGPEQEGLFGFMYKDILAELERSKKHKCSFCSKGGANLGCSISSCRKQFHLPCGRERNAISLYYGTYKSFCQLHAPKQSIPEHIMCNAKLRMKHMKVPITQGDDSTEDMVCVICYETVDGFPTVNTFWPPCCGKDAWFHRSCLQRMALSAGMHYLKCPLCNDKQNFYDAVIDQGYFVPDRDAAWELEQNAFAEIYERPLNCTAETCECPLGRNHDAEKGEWDIKLCLLCGSVGAHAHCIGASETTRYVCLTCTPAAPEDIEGLADTIEKMIVQEQAATTVTQRGPAMPSRMSLRRTKRRVAIATRPSSSRSDDAKTACENTHSPQTIASRQELNLSTPKKLAQPIRDNSYTSPYKSGSLEDSHKKEVSYKNFDSLKRLKSPVKISHGSPYKCMGALNSLVKIYKSLNQNNEVSYKMDGKYYKHEMDEPMNLLEQSLNEKVCMGVKDLDEEVVEMLRNKFKKPGPLSQKRKIIEEILNGLITNLNASEKHKEDLREWCSPRKSCDITEEILPSENPAKYPENTGEYKENCLQETPKKYNSSNGKKSAEDGKCHNSDTNIDLNATETKIRSNTEELNNKEISEDKDDYGRGESVKTVEPEERTGVASLEGDIDDSSNSTFQLPPEFVANTQSDKSNTSSPIRQSLDAIFSPSKNLKVKSDVSNDVSEAKCAFKFSPLDKEKLEKNNVGINIESFKKSYLSEVGKESPFDKHDKGNCNLSSVIDFAVDAHLKEKVVTPMKRKYSEGKLLLVFNKNNAKKRKLPEKDSNLSSSDDFEDKQEIKSPLAQINEEKFKVKILSKRNEKKRFKKKKEKKSPRSKSHDKIKIADKTIITEEKEETAKEIETEKHENISNLDNDSDVSNKTVNDKGNGQPKIKFQESSQWMAEITELDKKLEIEAKRKVRKNERKLTHKQFQKPGKDATINMQKKYPDDHKKDDNKLGTDKNCNNKMFDKVDVKEPKEVTIKANEKNRVGEIKKEKIRKHKREKLSRQQKRQHKLDKKHKENYGESKKNDNNIELTIDSSEKTLKKKNNKMKTKLSIRNNEKDISVKIKWKKKQLRLKIKQSKKEKIDKINNDHSKFKQYVLQYFSEITPKEVLVKPEKVVGPLKRKYVKQEKSPDKLKQMSIQSFFKTTSPN